MNGLAQKLETTIVINAQVGNNFSKIGSTLTELGSVVNGISGQLINFGKESVEVYRNYELSMVDAEVALSTKYGKDTRELSKVMQELDDAATEWAATTIFHTNDVGNAIAEAAHAGWDYEQIMSGIPAAMELAQAGGLNLSEAVNYIVKTANAAGIEFEDLDTLIDHWAFTANSSATDIGELGEAMLRMGATMQFAGGTDELLVMLAELANAGTTGADAGTLARNSFLRLVAPTQKASDVMAELGATSEEVEEILNDEALAAANARLEAEGFSAYDADGNLKDMLTTYRDLNVALQGISSEEERNSIISAIFPTRSLTGALAMLNAASEGYHGLYDALKDGSADDYGSYASEKMMDTLNGNIETFDSKVEHLKQVVGEELAPQIEGVLGGLGGIVDSIAGMDDASFSALVQGLEVIAGLGPGLLLAGGAARLVGSAIALFSNPLALGTAGVVALAAGVAILKNTLDAFRDAEYEAQFGNLELDNGEILEYISSIRAEFQEATSELTGYQEALSGAVKEYQDSSETLKSGLLTDLLTGKELEGADVSAYKDLGDRMIKAVQEGVESGYSETMLAITDAFGGDAGTDNPVWSEIMQVMEQGYQADLEKARSLGEELRKAMTEAFADGHLTGDEVASIQSIIDEQNEILARQMDVDNYVRQQAILRQGQTLGLDSMKDTIQAARDEMALEREYLQQEQDRSYAQLAYAYDWAIKNGTEITDAEGKTFIPTIDDKEAALGTLRKQFDDQIRGWESTGENLILDTVTAGLQENFPEVWNGLQGLVPDFRKLGGVVDPALEASRNEILGSQAEYVSRFLQEMVEELGGYEELGEYADYFEKNGDLARAEQYRNFMDLFDLTGRGMLGYADAGRQSRNEYTEEAGGKYEALQNVLSRNQNPQGEYFTPEDLLEYIQNAEANGMTPDWGTKLGDGLLSAVENVASSQGYEANYEGITSLVQSAGEQRVKVIPELDEGYLMDINPVPVPIEPYTGGENPAEELAEQGVDIQVNGDTQELQATIAAEDGQDILTYVNGDAENLHMVIVAEDGQTLLENVTGNASELEQVIDRYNGRTITVNIQANNMLPNLPLAAEGGRATSPAIFGEAGPEWAIPEEHSERTASLLNAAREASGFSWQELLSMYGGLNANTNAAPTTLVYSPTIQAADASGVEQILLEDKKRLERWWEQKQMRDEVEVYA